MLLLSSFKRLMGQFLSPQTPLRPGTLPPGPLFFGALTRASLFCASCFLPGGVDQVYQSHPMGSHNGCLNAREL